MHWTDILTSCGRRRKQGIEIPFSKLIFNPLFYTTNKEYLYGNNVLNKMYIAFKNYKYYRIKMIIHLQHSFKTKWIENNIGTELSMFSMTSAIRFVFAYCIVKSLGLTVTDAIRERCIFEKLPVNVMQSY